MSLNQRRAFLPAFVYFSHQNLLPHFFYKSSPFLFSVIKWNTNAHIKCIGINHCLLVYATCIKCLSGYNFFTCPCLQDAEVNCRAAHSLCGWSCVKIEVALMRPVASELRVHALRLQLIASGRSGIARGTVSKK